MKRSFEQDHMVRWIVNNVVKGITPQQVRLALYNCNSLWLKTRSHSVIYSVEISVECQICFHIISIINCHLLHRFVCFIEFCFGKCRWVFGYVFKLKSSHCITQVADCNF